LNFNVLGRACYFWQAFFFIFAYSTNSNRNQKTKPQEMSNYKYIFLILSLWPIIVTANTQTNIDSLKLQLEFAKNKEEKAATSLQIIKNKAYTTQEEALALANTAFLYYQDQGDKENTLEALRLQTSLDIGFYNYEKAMKAAQESVLIAQELEKPDVLAAIYFSIASIQNNLGNYQKGSEYYFLSLKLFEETNNKRGISDAYNGIGVVYYEQHEYQKALEYFFKALNISKDINDKTGESIGLNNVALVYEARKENKNARKYFKEALKLNQQTNNIKGAAINHLNLGIVNQELQENQKALTHFLEARKILFSLGHQRLFATSQMYLGAYFLQQKNYDNSLLYADSAYKLAKEKSYKKVIYKALDIQHQSFLQRQDTLTAYKYLVLLNAAKDSLNHEKNIEEISNLEMRYKFEKQIAEKKLKQEKKNFHVLLLLSFLSIVILFLFILFIRNKLKAKTQQVAKEKLQKELEIKEQEINFKNKELTTNVMHQMQKNEMITEISSKIIEIEKGAAKLETKDALNKIAVILTKSLQQDDLLRDFDIRFKDVHQDFPNTLLKKHPFLSPNELRLCSFLRLNMTTKEISRITGQSVRSIETARTRLRKKLGLLNSDINLVNYLMQI